MRRGQGARSVVTSCRPAPSGDTRSPAQPLLGLQPNAQPCGLSTSRMKSLQGLHTQVPQFQKEQGAGRQASQPRTNAGHGSGAHAAAHQQQSAEQKTARTERGFCSTSWRRWAWHASRFVFMRIPPHFRAASPLSAGRGPCRSRPLASVLLAAPTSARKRNFHTRWAECSESCVNK